MSTGSSTAPSTLILADAGHTPPSPVRVGPRRRYVSWDLLRCGFVLLVVLYHSTYVAPIVHPELAPRPFAFSHQVGASLLLVISAYFACATLPRSPVGRYWWGRMARLFPAFAASVLFTWAVVRYLSPADWPIPGIGDLVGNLLLLGNWQPAAFPFLDGSYWTLPLQLMAFTVAVLRWRSRWGRGSRLRVVLWAALLLPLAQWPLRIAQPPETYRMLVDGFGFHRLHLFVAGVAIWMWANNRLRTQQFLTLITTCVAAHLVHNIAVGPDGWHQDWAAAIGVSCGILLICLAARRPDWDRWVPTRMRSPLQWLAGISYGVYLIHQTVGFVLMRWMHDWGTGPFLQSAAMITMVLVLGWLLAQLIDAQPIRA
ncbi:MAG: acyltransferase [Actinobacteria bacterium]|nr:acyltransferase [Actinomycetota bacterium]